MKRPHPTKGIPLSQSQRELLSKVREVYPQVQSSISQRQKITIAVDTPAAAIDCMQLLHDLGFTGYQAMKWERDNSKTTALTQTRKVHAHFPRI